MSYLVPVGTQESISSFPTRMECLHLYLPPTLLDRSALADFDIDPAKVQIAYAERLTDPVLFHICLPLRDLLVVLASRPTRCSSKEFRSRLRLIFWRITQLTADEVHHHSIREGLSACWTISRLRSAADIRLGNGGPGVSQPLPFFPGYFAKRPGAVAAPLRHRSPRPGGAAGARPQQHLPGRNCPRIRLRLPS